jgi:hypothetical protein
MLELMHVFSNDHGELTFFVGLLSDLRALVFITRLKLKTLTSQVN